MKKIFYYSILFIGLFSSCDDKSEKKNQKETTIISTQKEEKENPQINVKVNKRYDKKGNLIAFDSTYSYYYSNRTGDKVLMDSLFKEFKPFIIKEFPLMKDKHFNDLFLNDTLFYNDFFHEDYFRKRLELNEKYMKNMMLQMDSIKNEFFKIHHKHPTKK
ncbi:MAG: hypothetical protein RI883_2569 [Bacteroidota bacterium]|jgi:hypothetical protein